MNLLVQCVPDANDGGEFIELHILFWVEDFVDYKKNKWVAFY